MSHYQSQLVAIGDSNWNLHVSINEIGGRSFWCKAKPESGASDCYFGDLGHIKRLIDQGCFGYTFVEGGLEVSGLSGLHSHLIKRNDGGTFGLIRSVAA